MNWRTIGSSVRLDLVDGADLADGALVEHGDAVAHRVRAPHVVGDHEPGTPRSRVRIISRSMIAEVTGSSPVVGSL